LKKIFNNTFKTVFVASSLSFILSASAYASAIEQFKTFVTNNKTAKGDFTQQQIKMVNGKPTVGKTSSGDFKFARPGKFIWIYIKPYEQMLQSDGDKLYIYDKDLNQVTIKKVGDAIASSPAAILFGNTDLDKNFNLKEAKLNQGIEWLDAIPKTKDSQFERISIGMKDGLPVAMELRDSFGQISIITFSNVEKNPNFSADQFKFIIPKGADVFQQ
jgi:outer membrane lipoprotein carrier protein